MENFLLVLLTLAVIVVTAKLILKKYNSILIFLLMGTVVLFFVTLITQKSIVPKDTTGNIYMDIFKIITTQTTKTLGKSGVGTIIMVVTGYAVYMQHIQASQTLARIATKPLIKLNKPYVVLAGTYIIGVFLKTMITSHAGLSMLLIATVYPILIGVGISKVSAAAGILACGALDWGPNNGGTLFAATKVLNIKPMDYIANYQVKIVLITMVCLAVILPLYYSHMDKKEGLLQSGANEKNPVASAEKIAQPEESTAEAPVFYCILPLIPLILMIIFSFSSSIDLDVISANFIGFGISFVCELITKRKISALSDGMTVILKSMGRSFANVVSIVIAAGVFAKGLNEIGGISIVGHFLASIEGMQLVTLFGVSLITFCGVILLGSGDATFFAFGPLIPGIAKDMGLATVSLTVPMQLGASLGRSLSPVCGALIAVSNVCEVDMFQVIKRNVVPMVIGFCVNIVASYLLLGRQQKSGQNVKH